MRQLYESNICCFKTLGILFLYNFVSGLDLANSFCIQTERAATMRIYHSLLNAARFRKVFDFGEREVAHWFPGHMAKGA